MFCGASMDLLGLAIIGIININFSFNGLCLIICLCDDFLMLALRILFDLVA